LKVFANRVARRNKGNEARESGRRLQKEELHDLYPRNITLMTNSRMMNVGRRVAFMWERICVQCFGRKN
jgi:hypothetical protein